MASKNGIKCITEKGSPQMLKDFLRDNSDHSTVQNLLDQPAAAASRSRAAFSSFQKLLHAVKLSFHVYNSSSSPLTLPRSLSRRFFGVGRTWYGKKKRCESSVGMRSNKMVVVKDILRWKSFRDELGYHQNEEEESQPSDFVGPSCSCNGGSGSSWVGEGIEDELPSWRVNSGDYDVVAMDPEVRPKEYNHNITREEDKEQHSPLSVLDSPFRDEISDEDQLVSSFDQSLANVERTKQRLLQSIQWFESLAGVHEEDIEEQEEEEDNAVEDKSRACLSRGLWRFKRGEHGLIEKEECFKDMEKHVQWSKFEEEKGELGEELQVEVLSDLVGEVLMDFFG